MGIRIGIAGISGYAGAELLRLAAGHDELDVVWGGGGRTAGQRLTDVWPALVGLPVPEQVAAADDVEGLLAASCEVALLALPHGHAAKLAPALLDAGLTVVDLGADFRLRDPAVYQAAYGLEHASPALLDEAVYGLPELHRARLPGARLIAGPGCYPTAVTLAARPLVSAGLADGPLVALCLSGASGAGRTPGPRNLYCEVHDAARPYGLAGTHRHVPEMEQTLGHEVVFSPHLVPMGRGLIATVHVRLTASLRPSALRELYVDTYGDEAMVTLVDAPPATSGVRGTNRALIHAALDERRGVAVVTCAIDNLVKGAAGQALQALNVARDWPEALGLPMHPVLP